MTCFEYLRQPMPQIAEPLVYDGFYVTKKDVESLKLLFGEPILTKLDYKAAHMSELLDHATGAYAGDPTIAIRKCLKQQQNLNGIHERMDSEDLDTVLLQENN